MAKDLRITFLLDCYGEMLTDKQREVVEAYCNEDLSLAEIAADNGITRQGVRDAIKRAEQQLLDMEERLILAKRFREVQKALTLICDCALSIQETNQELLRSAEINSNAAAIIATVRQAARARASAESFPQTSTWMTFSFEILVYHFKYQTGAFSENE